MDVMAQCRSRSIISRRGGDSDSIPFESDGIQLFNSMRDYARGLREAHSVHFVLATLRCVSKSKAKQMNRRKRRCEDQRSKIKKRIELRL